MSTHSKNHNPHADTEHIHVAVSPSDETAPMTDAEKAQLEEEDINMTKKYFKVWAIVMTVIIIIAIAVFAVSCDRNDPGTEDSNTTTTTTTQVTTTTSDEDDVTTTTRPKDTTTTKATTTAVTTTTSDEEDVTTTTTIATTTTNAQTTTTTTKVTTTTPQQTTTTVTTINVSENAKLVEELISNLGGVPTGNLDSYVANATTIEELHTAIKKYLTDEQLAYTVGDQLITMDMFTWLTDLEGRNLSAIVYRDGVGFALITNVDAENATFYMDGEFVVSVTVADEICNENWEMTPIVLYPN